MMKTIGNKSFCACEHALAMMVIVTGLLQNLANVITLKRILNLDIKSEIEDMSSENKVKLICRYLCPSQVCIL